MSARLPNANGPFNLLLSLIWSSLRVMAPKGDRLFFPWQLSLRSMPGRERDAGCPEAQEGRSINFVRSHLFVDSSRRGCGSNIGSQNGTLAYMSGNMAYLQSISWWVYFDPYPFGDSHGIGESLARGISHRRGGRGVQGRRGARLCATCHPGFLAGEIGRG